MVSGERREQGVVDSIDEDGTGFAQLAERDIKIPFKLTEMLDADNDCSVGDEVEFTTIMVKYKIGFLYESTTKYNSTSPSKKKSRCARIDNRLRVPKIIYSRQ